MNKPPLHRAAANGELDRIRGLLDAGADIHAGHETDPSLGPMFPSGRTALHEATMHRQLSAVRELLTRGADPNQCDALGEAAQHLCPNAMVTRFLLAAGADPTMRSLDGQTPLHSAAKPESARVLLDAGADLDAVDNAGLTPIDRTHEPLVFRYFWDLGARPRTNTNSDTILEQAEEWHIPDRSAAFLPDLLARLEKAFLNQTSEVLCADARDGRILLDHGTLMTKAVLDEIAKSADYLEADPGAWWERFLRLRQWSITATEHPHQYLAWVRLELCNAPEGSTETPSGLVVEMHEENFLFFQRDPITGTWVWESELAPGRHTLSRKLEFEVATSPAAVLKDEETLEIFHDDSIPSQVFRL